MKKAIDRFLNTFPFLVCAGAVFLNLAGWLADLWSLPAAAIAVSFLLFTPLIAAGLRLLWQKFMRSLEAIGAKRLILLALFSLIPAILLALAFPHQLDSSIVITPAISDGQEVTLLEFKTGGHILPLGDIAESYGWQVTEEGITASARSRPLLVQFKSRAGSPVSIIFQAGPQSGSASVQYGSKREEVALITSETGEALITLRSNFRGLPNWLFIPLVTGADILAWFLYAFAIFILQDFGQGELARKGKPHEKFLSHPAGLAILISIAAVFHAINALSVPLIFGADSPSFIRGAFHLVEHGDFQGVSMIRGPGTALLFAPVIALFGRDPWGVKILLHLLALALVPLSYRIGWQLGGRRRIAFLCGLAAALMPDPYFFSNFLMSDLPNLVVISAFATLLISALQTGGKRSIFGALLTAGFGVLLRSENLALLALGAFALAVQPLWECPGGGEVRGLRHKIGRRALTVGLALLAALLPVLCWSWHNYRSYGSFGMGNYGGEVFYTGWIYYAEGSGYPFTDRDSPAVQAIQAAVDEHPIEHMNEAGVPTGWNLYPSLIQAGYTPKEAFNLMTRAAWDSIRANPRMAREVLAVKLKDGLTPVPTQMKTFHLPGEDAPDEALKDQFFDSESLRLPAVIRLQRGIYRPLETFYKNFYPLLVWAGLAAVYFSLLRKPALAWWALAAIALTRVFIPDVMGKADWRYTLGGMLLIQAVTVLVLAAVIAGVKGIVSRLYLPR